MFQMLKRNDSACEKQHAIVSNGHHEGFTNEIRVRLSHFTNGANGFAMFLCRREREQKWYIGDLGSRTRNSTDRDRTTRTRSQTRSVEFGFCRRAQIPRANQVCLFLFFLFIVRIRVWWLFFRVDTSKTNESISRAIVNSCPSRVFKYDDVTRQAVVTSPENCTFCNVTHFF
jgi:hypothetical protein